MRFRLAPLLLLVFAGVLAAPLLAHATGIPNWDPIIPTSYNECPGAWGLVVLVVNNIITKLLTIAIFFVVPLLIAYAGFLLVVNSVNPSGKERARSILTNTIIGLVVALAAWIIVDAFMAVFYNGTFGTWSQIIRGDTSNTCLQVAGSLHSTTLNGSNVGITGSTAGGNVVTTSGASAGDEAAVRKTLADAGITINHDACPAGSSGQGCTNVGGLQSSTVQQAIIIKQSCKTDLQITGGTEPGHAGGAHSHGAGYKLDLHPTTSLDSCLKSMTSLGTRTGDAPGPAYTDACGSNQYVRESDHWDITILSTCSPLK